MFRLQPPKLITIAALTLSLFAGGASAATITFDQVEEGGTLVPDGSGGWIGSNIIFEYIVYDASPLNAVFCGDVANKNTGSNINCLLNFDTASGSFVLTAPAGLYDSSGNLLPGFDGSSVDVLSGLILLWQTGGVGDVFFFAAGIDAKNPDLLDYFGLPNNLFIFQESTIRRTTGGTVTQADITNTITDTTIDRLPEPGLLMLLGVGVLGARRRVMNLMRPRT